MPEKGKRGVQETDEDLFEKYRQKYPEEYLEGKKNLAAPCSLYCGTCAIYIAHRDNNLKFKERLVPAYGVPVEEIKCDGALSDNLFIYCQTCPIKSCILEKGIEGCHQCDDFPCEVIENFPIPVGREVILRAVPFRRKFGTKKWMEEEEKRYLCPYCGYPTFRGVKRCRNCKKPLYLD